MSAESVTPPRLSRRLIGLNIALLAVLAVVTIAGVVSSRADAQQPGGAVPLPRMRGEYTMVAGKIQGATTQSLYIIDAANQELVALSWDRANNRFEPIGHRSIADDAKYLTKPR